MKDKIYQYYVEGQDEKKIIDTLKSELMCIFPGKVQVFNVVQERMSKARIMALKDDTVVILVFDTDAGSRAILDANIKILEDSNNVKEVWCITQVNNLEDELVRSCNIKKIEDLLGSKTTKEYKSDLIKEKNLASKLQKAEFDIRKIWTMQPSGQYAGIINDGAKIKY